MTIRPQASMVERLLRLPAYLLFFLLLVFPMVIQLLYVKALLFTLVLFILALRTLFQGRLSLHPSIAVWSLFVTAVSLAFVFEGLLARAPGAIKQAELYVLWPIVYTLVIAGASTLGVLVGLQRVLILATLCAGAYGLNYLLTQLRILPAFLHVPVFQVESIGLPRGYLKISLYFLNSLPFLAPFVMASLVNNAGARSDVRMPSWWLWTAVGLGAGVALASGRRALVLITAAAPLVVLAFTLLRRGPHKLREAGRLIALVGMVTLLISLVAVLLTSYIRVGLDRAIPYFTGAIDPRSSQFQALMEDWAERPLLGAGHGATTPGSTRSETQPWSYELSYVALLFQTGLLGFAAYAAGVLWIYWMGVRIIRAGGILGDLMFPILVGTSCFLIANAVDPYLARFDGLWVIFLPLAVINAWLLTKDQRPAGDAGVLKP